MEVAGKKSLDLLDRSTLDHAGEPQVAPFVKPFTLGQEDQRKQFDCLANAAFAMSLPIGEGLTGRADHLQGSGDARGIGLIERGGSLRIFDQQRGVCVGDFESANLLAYCWIYRRHRSDAVEQCANIEPGSADEDWDCSFRMCRRDLASGVSGPVDSGAGLGTVTDPEQAVFDPAHVLLSGTGAQYPEVAVYLRAVGIDYHAPLATPFELKCKLYGQIALAAGGRPCN